MRHGSLFSGIGGFDLAAEWMGWENVFHCEWNEFGQKVLKHYWPKAISYADITKTDFTIHRGSIDILTGGFPCQPYSVAGKQKGTEDERHLWPEMLRAIREIQPQFVVGENVPGLVSWDGGLVFDQVQTDLEAQGYQVTPFILPAAALDAPHGRARVWFVAYSESNRINRRCANSNRQEECSEVGQRVFMETTGFSKIGNASNAIDEGLQGSEQDAFQGSRGFNKGRTVAEFYKTQDWSEWPTQWPICAGNDGLSAQLDGITFPKWRNESIKAGGNAIVPQVAHQIFKAIEQYTRA